MTETDADAPVGRRRSSDVASADSSVEVTAEACEAARALAAECAQRCGDDAAALENALRTSGLLGDDVPELALVEAAAVAARQDLQAALRGLARAPRDGDPVVAAALAGAALGAVDVAISYAQQREVFGRPITRFQVQRHAFALSVARGEAALALARRACTGGDPLDVAACVPAAADAAWLAVDHALQVHGGHGYADDSAISGRWRAVVAVRSTLPLADAALHAASGRAAPPQLQENQP